MATRDGFEPGRRITRESLNERLAAAPAAQVSGPGVFSTRGKAVIKDEEEIFFRITGVGTSPRRYAWREVAHDKFTGAWSLSNRVGGLGDDPAFEANDATLSAGNRIYRARRSRASGAWIFAEGGSGGGKIDLTAGETAIYILGPWEDYKDCPGAPPPPPTAKTPCGEPTSTVCVPHYAFAVYQLCGGIWVKIGDSRIDSFGVWASPLNGVALSAMRRFYIPRWGGAIDPLTGLPDPDSDCMGVKVLEYCAAPTLSCTCPACISDPPEDKCIAIRFKTVPRPCPPDPMNIGCGHPCQGTFVAMDTGNAWDKEYEIKLDPIDCEVSNTSTDGLFGFAWQYYDEMEPCDWGPDQIDPCNLCAHWGLFKARIAVPGNSGPDTADPNCESGGHVRFRFLAREVCDLICNCSNAPLAPYDLVQCDECAWDVEGPGGGTGIGEEGGGGTPLPPMHFIVPESIQLVCCTT